MRNDKKAPNIVTQDMISIKSIWSTEKRRSSINNNVTEYKRLDST